METLTGSLEVLHFTRRSLSKVTRQVSERGVIRKISNKQIRAVLRSYTWLRSLQLPNPFIMVLLLPTKSLTKFIRATPVDRLRIKQTVPEADRSPPFGANDTNAWNYTSTPPYVCTTLGWKHRNFSFLYRLINLSCCNQTFSTTFLNADHVQPFNIKLM
jgi:hypothetical protein